MQLNWDIPLTLYLSDIQVPRVLTKIDLALVICNLSKQAKTAGTVLAFSFALCHLAAALSDDMYFGALLTTYPNVPQFFPGCLSFGQIMNIFILAPQGF